VNARGTKLLGYVVWRGGRWYLRRRMPPARSLALGALAAGGALTAVVLLGRRALG
jgi:hypothetical protein